MLESKVFFPQFNGNGKNKGRLGAIVLNYCKEKDCYCEHSEPLQDHSGFVCNEVKCVLEEDDGKE